MKKAVLERFFNRIRSLESQDILDTFKSILRGFEKECLRTSLSGQLALTPHPKSLGSSLTHPFITTDYSEALLEFITAPSESIAATLQQLNDIHCFVHHNLSQDQELLWGASMPCALPQQDHDIPIAQYGSSNLGQLKEVYRKGLGLRYGRKMQTIAGVHYNFSFPMSFWTPYQEILTAETPATAKAPASGSLPLASFISDQYFGLIRNVLRWRWLLPLWFGASPAMDQSFMNTSNAGGTTAPIAVQGLQPCSWLQQKNDTLISPEATTLRLSDLGYSNARAHAQSAISYRNLSDFIASMKQAVTTPLPDFEKLGVRSAQGEYQQLNNTILQVEDEYYGAVRPKRVLHPGERLIHALSQRGVEYLEVRALDLNPFHPTGVSSSDIYLLDSFLITCLLLESTPLSGAEEQRSVHNYQAVITQGRQPNRMLLDENNKAVDLATLGHSFMEAMRTVSHHLDALHHSNDHSAAVQRADAWLKHPENSLSAQVFDRMEGDRLSHHQFVLQQSQQHQAYFQKQALAEPRLAEFRKMAEDSHKARALMEQHAGPPFELFLKQYLAQVS